VKRLVRFLSRWAWSAEKRELAYWHRQLDAEPKGVLLVPLIGGGCGVSLRTYNMAVLRATTPGAGKEDVR